MPTNLIIDTRDLDDLNACIKTMLELGPVSVQLKSHTKRSIPQNATAHMWFGELSRWLISKGKDFATPEWVKEAMKSTFLGYVEVIDTDVITGKKTSRQELRRTSSLDTGEMKLFMDMVYHWALDRGMMLTIPDGCEYQKLTKQENGYE
jgi:hypothetical protein